MFDKFVQWLNSLPQDEFDLLRQGYNVARAYHADSDEIPAHFLLIKDAMDARRALQLGDALALQECVQSFSSTAFDLSDATSDDRLILAGQDFIQRGANIGRWHEMAVTPPEADGIKAVRQAVGTQALCAALSGVNLSNWQRWEKGETSPHPSIWGAFLLSIGQHPRYSVSAK
mgnify:CR=1 FL=1